MAEGGEGLWAFVKTVMNRSVIKRRRNSWLAEWLLLLTLCPVQFGTSRFIQLFVSVLLELTSVMYILHRRRLN
jgi:hypothetical protein